MTNFSNPENLDTVFHALSHPARRSVLAALMTEDASVQDLAKPFAMALPTFLKHLKVLEESGLITTRKRGRVRTCKANPDRLEMAERWIADHRAVWTRRLDQLGDYLARTKGARDAAQDD